MCSDVRRRSSVFLLLVRSQPGMLLSLFSADIAMGGNDFSLARLFCQVAAAAAASTATPIPIFHTFIKLGTFGFCTFLQQSIVYNKCTYFTFLFVYHWKGFFLKSSVIDYLLPQCKFWLIRTYVCVIMGLKSVWQKKLFFQSSDVKIIYLFLFFQSIMHGTLKKN